MSEILFLPHRFPYPPDRGDKIRSWHILKGLAQLAPVHLATFVEDERDFSHIDTVKSLCASVYAEPRSRTKAEAMALALATGKPASVAAFGSHKLQAKVDTLLNERSISCIFAFSGQMAQFVPIKRENVRFVMDFVDVDSAKFHTYADQTSGISAFANKFEGNRLAAFEKAVADRADLSLFVSEAEAALFRSHTHLSPMRVQALDNGIDLDRYDPSLTFDRPEPSDRPMIVFTGQMDYRPNIDAVTAFAKETMPIILQSIPNAVFAIVGRAPTDHVLALASQPGVIVTGEVADTRAWLAHAAVVVAPLKLARGVQNKVLEAMAMRKAVVASSAAAEGIRVTPGQGIIVADQPEDEAREVIALIHNVNRADLIAAAARQCIADGYSWDAQLAPLKSMVFPEQLDRAAA
jgi:polysaccharide biosynthesis protein PslH